MPQPSHSSPRHNGEAIRTIRKLRKLAMKELAATVGITPQSLSNVENERKPVSFELLNRIADALEVPLDAITRVRIATGRRPAQLVPKQEDAA